VPTANDHYLFDLSQASAGGIPVKISHSSLPKSYGFLFDGSSDDGEDEYEQHRLRSDEVDFSGLEIQATEDGGIRVAGLASIQDRNRSESERFFSGCDNGEVQISICLTDADGQEISPWSDRFALPCRRENRVDGWKMDESYTAPQEMHDREIMFIFLIDNQLSWLDEGSDRREILEKLVLADWVGYAWGNYHCEFDFAAQTHIYKHEEMNNLESQVSFGKALSCLSADALFFADEEKRRIAQISLDEDSIVSFIQSHEALNVRAVVLRYDDGDGWDD